MDAGRPAHAPISDGEIDRALAEGDADADAAIAHACGGDAGATAQAVGALLAWNLRDAPPPGVPASLVDYVSHPRPDEGTLTAAEAAHLDRAQRLFTRLRLPGIAVLACAGLPACYAVPSIADVLADSGRLLDRVRGRLQETVYFVSVVMAPGALAAEGMGLRWLRKVRLVHALTRLHVPGDAGARQRRTGDRLADILLRTPRDRSRSVPASQAEQGYVLLTFSWLLLRGWERLGIVLTHEERESFVVAWSVIGRHLGIREAMRGYADGTDDAVAGAERFFERLRARLEHGTEEGRLLAGALLVVLAEEQRAALRDLIAPVLPDWVRLYLREMLARLPRFSEQCLQSVPRTMIRRLAGPETAERLWVPRAPLLHWLASGVVMDRIPWADVRLPDDSGAAPAAPHRLREAATHPQSP